MSSSLRELDRLEDRIRQHRQVERSPILIVEGPDDILVLREHLPREIIFAADGKRNALRAMDSLGAWGFVGIRAVLDADFDEPEDGRSDPRILLYEGRDLEAMLVLLGVLARILDHQGSAAKVESLGGARELCGQLISQAHAVAEIRAANHKESWGLRFDDVDIAAKTDRRTLKIDLQRLVAALIQASDTDVSSAEVLRVVKGDTLDGRGPRGKDVLALAGLALRHKAGSLPVAATVVDVISAQLRSSAGLLVERSAWLTSIHAAIHAADAELKTEAA